MSVLSQPTPQISVGPPPTLTYQVSVTNGQAYTLSVFQTLNGTDTIVVSPTSYTGTGSLQTYTFTSPVTSYAYFTRVLIGSTTTDSTSILYYSPYQGPQGVQGNPGIQGAIGPGGQKGDQGPPGLQGIVSIDNYVTSNYLITSGSSSGKVNAHSNVVLDAAGALSGITTIQAGGGSSTIGSVTLNGGTINTSSTLSNKIGGVTLSNGRISAPLANTVTGATAIVSSLAAVNGGAYNATAPQLELQYQTGGTTHYISSRHWQGQANNAGNAIDFWLYSSIGGNAGSSTTPGTGNVNTMSVTAAGVGISQTSPAYNLDVNGNARTGGSITTVFTENFLNTTAALSDGGFLYSTSLNPIQTGWAWTNGGIIRGSNASWLSTSWATSPMAGYTAFVQASYTSTSTLTRSSLTIPSGVAATLTFWYVARGGTSPITIPASFTVAYGSTIIGGPYNTLSSNTWTFATLPFTTSGANSNIIFTVNNITPISAGDSTILLQNVQLTYTPIASPGLDVYGGAQITGTGGTNIASYGPGYDTLTLKNTLPAYSGGTTSIAFSNQANNYPLGRIYASEFGITPGSAFRSTLGFQVNGRSGGNLLSNVMNITDLGVGIFNNNPAYALDVNGTIRGTLVGNISTSTQATFQSHATGGIWYYTTDGSPRLRFASGTSSSSSTLADGNSIIFQTPVNTTMANITSTGMRVGDGTAASYMLDVSGTIRATTDVLVTSDMRSKTNIDTISNALLKVNSLRGVTYTPNSEPDVRKIGVIAQEIEQIIPEVVSTDASPEQNKAVAYGNITAVLIEAIKELTQRLEVLEKMKG